MAKQAKVLTKAEFMRVLAVINANKHAQRNTAIFYLSFYGGLRAIEIASLRMFDVVNDDKQVKAQFVLEKHMTKGNDRHRVIGSSACLCCNFWHCYNSK